MQYLRVFFMVFTGFFLSATVPAQSSKTDYLSVPGPVVFDGKSYSLAWSAHPSAAYYKQEYVIKGESVERFKTMLMLEVLTGDVKVKDVVAAKIEELKKMKASNPIVQYEMFRKDGEYIVDFLLSAGDIVERNVYRYKSLSGQQGIVLFAVSTRAYGKDIDQFLINLKTTKSKGVNAVAQFKMPAVIVKP